MGWFGRKAEPKEEHPSTYEGSPTPLQGSDNPLLNRPQNPALDITIRKGWRDDPIPLDERLTYPPRRGPRADPSIICKRYQ